MKSNPLVTGTIAIASPFPMFMLAILWSWVWVFIIGMGLLHYDTVPQWMLVLSLLPLLISPLFCLLGIIHGIVRINTKKSWLGILLSVMGLLENFVLFYGIYYLGSRY